MTDSGKSIHQPLKRFTTAEKVNAVLRLVKGESREALSSELGVAIRRLERWNHDFIAGGSEALKTTRSLDSRNWVAKHATGILQWVASLIGLGIMSGLLALFLQRKGGG
jgi:hypothetical protein